MNCGLQKYGPLMIIALSVLGLSGCKDGSDASTVWSGYIEAERTFIAAPSSGWIEDMQVVEGDRLPVGATVFRLEQEKEAAALAESQARLAEAKAKAEDLLTGARAEELAVIRQQRREAQAELTYAKAERNRWQQLVDRNVAAQARLDRAVSDYGTALAKVRRLTAELKAAELAGRDAAQAAAFAAQDAAEQAVVQAQWVQQQRTVTAKVAGAVDDIYFRAGEYVTAGTPVLSMLQPQALKVRFYVAQADVSRLKLGGAVEILIDGVKAAVSAKVSHISDEVEYTPPVIFSNTVREKLVFMVEARPLAEADGRDATLHPGQPVDVRLP